MSFDTHIQSARKAYNYNRTVTFWIMNREVPKADEFPAIMEYANYTMQNDLASWQKAQADLELKMNDSSRWSEETPDGESWSKLREYMNDPTKWNVLVKELELVGLERHNTITTLGHRARAQHESPDGRLAISAAKPTIVIGLERHCNEAKQRWHDNRAATHWICAKESADPAEFPAIGEFLSKVAEGGFEDWGGFVEEIEYIMNPQALGSWASGTKPESRRIHGPSYQLLKEYIAKPSTWKDIVAKLEASGKTLYDEHAKLIEEKVQVSLQEYHQIRAMAPSSSQAPPKTANGKDMTRSYSETAERSPRETLSVLPLDGPVLAPALNSAGQPHREKAPLDIKDMIQLGPRDPNNIWPRMSKA